MISEDPAPENKGQSDDRPESIMIYCQHCSDFLIREIAGKNIEIYLIAKKLEILKIRMNSDPENALKT